MANDLEASILANGGQQIPKAFMEQASIKMALESQAGTPIHRHSEILLADRGASTISDQVTGKPPANYQLYVDYQLSYETKTGTLMGFVEPLNGAPNDVDQVTIDMDLSRNQTSALKDIDRKDIQKTYGSCLSSGTDTDACKFSVTGKVDATIEGSRKWLTSDHSIAQYVLHSAGDEKTSLGSMKIETQLVGKKIIMDVDINAE